MATYLKYVPSNPIVVEGYATQGTTDERFRLGRIRAGIVREYLLGRYELMPQNTGFISLADGAKGSPQRGPVGWCGDCAFPRHRGVAVRGRALNIRVALILEGDYRWA
jgi:hypothetical protein